MMEVLWTEQLKNYQPFILQTRPSLSPEEINALLIANCVLSVLSILGSILNVLVIIFFKIEGPTAKMVMCISAITIAGSIPSALQPIQITKIIICQVETSIKFFGYGACFAWSCCFAHALYTAARKGGNVEVLHNFFKNYSVISATCGFIYGVLGLASVGKKIHPETDVCLFAIIKQSCTTEFGINTVPSIIGVLLCCIFYRKSKSGLHLIPTRIHPELRVFPIIFCICVIPRIFRELAIFFSIESPFGLYLIAEMLYSSQGLLNSIAYLLSRRVLDSFLVIFRPKEELVRGDRCISSSTNYYLRNSV